jgi:hypothetical protein
MVSLISGIAAGKPNSLQYTRARVCYEKTFRYRLGLEDGSSIIRRKLSSQEKFQP